MSSSTIQRAKGKEIAEEIRPARSQRPIIAAAVQSCAPFPAFPAPGAAGYSCIVLFEDSKTSSEGTKQE